MKHLSYQSRKRINMYFGLIEGFVALCILVTTVILYNTLQLATDTITFPSIIGLSSGMAGAGFGIFFRTRKLLHNPEQLKSNQIRDMDERNQYIASQAARLAFWTMLILTYLAAVVSVFFQPALYFFLCVQIVVMLILYLIFARILGRTCC
nr:hypothetical protein [uncultured Butyricicoccus sp.]